jgi:predicted RNA binding protein YcfA (HicA-like mRNA interferase family)
MKLPRDLGGAELAGLLGRYGYVVTRQTGSHMRLTTSSHGEHHVTIPRHAPLSVGTLNAILREIADHLGMDRQAILEGLFGEG